MSDHADDPTDAIAAEQDSTEKLEEGPTPPPNDSRSSSSSGSGRVPNLAKIFKFGEKGSGTRSPGEVQDFNLLRKKCLAEGILFEDPDFPAQLSSIYGSKQVEKNIIWRRPPGIVSDPEFFVEGPSRFDVMQGISFGDCWLMAAIASLAMDKTLFYQVVPQDQSFRKGQYAGIFHFRFWQYGRWVDVVIDDRLPMYDRYLLGQRSAENNEFWSALLEKAYAKLNGSYEALDGGFTVDALQDFTGGITELYASNETPPDFFNMMLKAHEKNALMACGFQKGRKRNKDDQDNEIKENEAGGDNENVEDNEVDGTVTEDNVNEVGEYPEEDKELQGLLERHAYSITQVRYVHLKDENQEKIPLVRVRNPWGTNDEWTGPWSDNSSEWESVSDEERKELDFEAGADGEFWMSFQDFVDHLNDFEICYLNPNSLPDNNLSSDKKEWETSTFEGEWVRGATAGGSPDNLENFQYNPQYLITLEEEGTVIVALTQKHRRSQARAGVAFLFIGFSIYRLKKNPSELSRPLELDFFEDSENKKLDIDSLKKKSTPKSLQYSSYRQVSCCLELQPGAYCIIPSTSKPDEEGEFLLRVFSEKPHNMEEYAEEVGVDEVPVDDQAPNELREGKLRDHFRLRSGEDWELDWIEYKTILNITMATELHNDGLSKDVCRSMIAMLDTDQSGKVGFHEYQIFSKELMRLTNSFVTIAQNYENPEVGYMSTFGLRKALSEAGYHVNNHMLCRLVRRYGTEDQRITFEDFIMCAVRLRTMIGTFKEHSQGQKNTATFTMEDWFDTTLYL